MQIKEESKSQPRTPKVPWLEEGESSPRRVTEYYRLLSRTMLSQSGERTLTSTIIPEKVGHLDLGFALTFRDTDKLPEVASLFFSVAYDFFIKSTEKGHFRNDLASILALPDLGEKRSILSIGTLQHALES